MAPRPRVWFDHFVVAIHDLDHGVETFEALTGVRPANGGVHPTLGTHNALVSLGEDQYFEIMAPRAGAELAPMVQGVDEYEALTPFLWALATDDIGGLRDRLATEGFAPNDVVAGSRETGDGDTLFWSMFTLGGTPPAWAPFFIQWDPSTTHPSTSTPSGCSLDTFRIESPDRPDLQRVLTVAGFVAPLAEGDARMMISLDTPRGVVTLGA